MAWSYTSGSTVSITGTVSLEDAAGDGVPTSGVNYISALGLSTHNCWVLRSLSVIFPTGADATWEEYDAIIVHGDGNNNQGVDLSERNGNKVIFGRATNLGSDDKPVPYSGCYYRYDQDIESATCQGYGWGGVSATFEAGSCDIFGGGFDCPQVQTGSGGGTLFYWPTGDVRIVGVNFGIDAGNRFNDTTGRLQEISFGGSQRKGTSMPASTGVIKDLTWQDNINHLDMSYFSESDFGCVNAAFRDRAATSQDDVKFEDWSAQATPGEQIGTLDDSDSVDQWSGNIGTQGGSGVKFSERTSYNLKTIDESGSNLASVNARVIRTETKVGEGATWSTIAGGADELAIGATDAAGERPELLLVRREYPDGNPPTRTHYRGFFATLRKYGYDYEHIAKYPQFGQGRGLIDIIIMKTNPFTVDTESNVSAYTGISLDIGTQTITLTSSHTLQELYDWLQWECAKQANMDFESGGNGVEFSPLTTADGSVFVVGSGWTITGDNYIDLDGKVLELASGNRYVTVELLSCIEGASYVIEETGGAILYSGIIDTTEQFQIRRTWPQSNTNVDIIVRLQGYLNYETSATITGNGLSLTVNQGDLVDPRYKINKGRFKQTHFRFRNDNDDEADATWKAAEDTNITGQAKSTNFRLRFQVKETEGKEGTVKPRPQYRKVGDDAWKDVS